MATSTSAPRSGVAAQPPRSRPPTTYMPLQQLNQNTATGIQGCGENNNNNASRNANRNDINSKNDNNNEENLEAAFSKQVATLSSIVATLQKEAEGAAFEAASLRELASAKVKEASSSSSLNSELRAKFVLISREAAKEAEALAAANEAAASIAEKLSTCARKEAEAEAAVAAAVARTQKFEEETLKAREEVAATRRELRIAQATAAEAVSRERAEAKLRSEAENKLAEEQKKFNATMASFGVGGGAFGGFGGFGRG